MLQGYERLCYLIGKVNVDKLKDLADDRGRIYIPYTPDRTVLREYLTEEALETLVDNHGGERVTIIATKNEKLERIIKLCLDEGIPRSDIHMCVRANYKEIDATIKKVLGLTPSLSAGKEARSLCSD